MIRFLLVFSVPFLTSSRMYIVEVENENKDIGQFGDYTSFENNFVLRHFTIPKTRVSRPPQPSSTPPTTQHSLSASEEESKKEKNRTLNNSTFSTKVQRGEQKVKRCDQPNGVKGRCEAWIPMWTFHKNSNKCEKFIFGGCEGNYNRFKTKAECEEECAVANQVPAESSCVWSVDCYDKTKRMLCSGPWNDAPCKCIFGKCKFTTDVAYPDGCTTYKDCDCKHNRDTCFCVGGSCNLRGPWECHQHPGERYSEDCRNMKKCDGIRCYCNDGACEKLEDNSTEPIGTGTSGNIDILDVEKTSPTPIGGLCWENKETMKECNGTCIPKLNLCNGSCSPNQCLKKDNSSCVEMFEDGNIFRKMLFKECKGHCIPASQKCEDQCLASQCWEGGSGRCVSPKLDRTQKQTQKGIYSWKNCEGNCIKSSDTCNSTCGDQKLFCLDEKSKKCLSLEETNEQGKKLRSQCRGQCIPFGEKCDGGCGATECEQDGKCLDALQLDKKNERIRQFCEGKCIPWGEVCGAK